MIRLELKSTTLSGSNVLGNMSSEILIPVNGGQTEPQYTNQSEFSISGQEPPTPVRVRERLLQFLEACLDAPVSEHVSVVIDAGIQGSNAQTMTQLQASQEETVDDAFSMNLYYEVGNQDLNAPPQYNGNISWIEWEVSKEAVQKYGFRYDGLDRLISAKYTGIQDEKKQCADDIPAGAYDVETINYDALGNISYLTRKGLANDDLQNPVYDLIDDLTYGYTGTSKLSSVNDASLDTKGFKGDDSDYSHDGTGNLIAMSGLSLSASYNMLDLPYLIESDYGKLEVVYDANGNKLKQQIREGDNEDVWLYQDGIEYRNDTLKTIHHEEGRVRCEDPPQLAGRMEGANSTKAGPAACSANALPVIKGPRQGSIPAQIPPQEPFQGQKQ